MDDNVDELHAGDHELNLELLRTGEVGHQGLEPMRLSHFLQHNTSIKCFRNSSLRRIFCLDPHKNNADICSWGGGELILFDRTKLCDIWG